MVSGGKNPKRGYGVVAEFTAPEEILEAARAARAAGYRKMDAYSPMPVEGLAEEIGFPRTALPKIVLLGGILGGLTGYGMCWYANVLSFPLDIGGKPYNSWPAWIPITFELTILGAAIFCVVGMLALNGLPQPYHPVFNVAQFAGASTDRFFLCLESQDGKFDPAGTRAFLESLHPAGVYEVEL